MFNFDEANAKSKELLETMTKSFASMSQAFQAIATEATDYSKKSMEESVAHIEKLMSVKSVEAATELQTAFAKSSYEGFVAQATKLTDMYADLATKVYKPFEAPIAAPKAPVAKAAKAVAATAEVAA